MSVIDNTGSITIKTLAEAKAYIDSLRLTDNESGLTYDIFPGLQQGYCNAGATGTLNVRLRNNGDAQAYIYMIMTRLDTNQQLFNYSFYLAPNATADITPTNFVMPAVDLVLQFEIGHFG